MSHWRFGLVAAAAAGLTATLALQLGPVLRAAASASGPDDLVTAGCLLSALLVGTWLAASALAASLALLPGGSGRALGCVERRLAPLAVRHLVRLAAGATVATALAGTVLSPATAIGAPELAGAGAPPPVRYEPSGSDAHRARLPVLDRLARPTRPPARRSGEGSRPTYVVRPGDTLWEIAGAALPGTASAADIAKAWPRWWRLNRSVVGADPGLILPGQVLRVPRRSPR